MISLQPPLAGSLRVTQKFGENTELYREYGLAGHEGLDFGCPTGTPVLAAHPGRCSPSAGTVYGNQVWLFGEGIVTLYAHLSAVTVGQGELVEVGAQLGLSGNTGRTTGPHLHFGVKFPGLSNPGYHSWQDPERYLRRLEMLKVGWHLGNNGPITDADWEIMGLVKPGVVCLLSGEQIAPSPDGLGILALNPDCHFIIRPYFDPHSLGDSNNPNYADVLPGYFDQCKRAMDDWAAIVPDGQKHLQIFNEQNMPRWSAWEGFGIHRGDMDKFNEWWLNGYNTLKAHDPSWQIGWTPLTIGNYDAWFDGDHENVSYYMHGPEAAKPDANEAEKRTAILNGPCYDSLYMADEYYAHIYVHEHPPGALYGGLRFTRYAAFLPLPKPMWITECGYPNSVMWQDGDRLIEWLNRVTMATAQGKANVLGVTFWILGDNPMWGSPWYHNQQPKPEVYQIKEWLEQEPPEPPNDNFTSAERIALQQAWWRANASVKWAAKQGNFFVTEVPRASAGSPILSIVWNPERQVFQNIKQAPPTPAEPLGAQLAEEDRE